MHNPHHVSEVAFFTPPPHLHTPSLHQPAKDYSRKHLSFPEFDGDSDVVTFLTIFEMVCQALGCSDPLTMKVALLGKLTGAAAAWL